MKTKTVSVKDIVILPGRGRQKFEQTLEMAESLKRLKFIHPIVVSPHPDQPGKYILVAGERRYRGALLAGMTEIPITLREDLDDISRKEIELEENIRRRDLSGEEERELMTQLDELKRSKDSTWTAEKTAELIGISGAHLSRAMTYTKAIRADPALREKVKNLPLSDALKVIKQTERAGRVERLHKAGKLDLKNDLRFGDARTLIKTLPTDSVDLLLTDPPYGIANLEGLRKSGGIISGFQSTSETHNQGISDVLKLLRELAPELVRVLKPKAHFYVFCGVQHLGAFIEALSPLQWQPPALVWDHGRTTQPFLGYNYMSRCDFFIFGHNPPRERRLARPMGNVFEFPEPTRNADRFPTQKPTSLLRVLIEQSTDLGEVVLDPFAGSGSTLSAAKASGRTGIGFEVDKTTWAAALDRLSSEANR
jgi:site-specific DNA-methyltransferase (adenine-specific)